MMEAMVGRCAGRERVHERVLLLLRVFALSHVGI